MSDSDSSFAPGHRGVSGGDPPSATEAEGESGSQVSGKWNDRILGLAGLAISVAFVAESRSFTVVGDLGGPVGPSTLPTAVGILFGAISIAVFLLAEDGPSWPTKSAWWQICLVIVSSYIYGQVLEFLGFIVASTAMAIVVGALFRAPMQRLVPMAFVFCVGMAYVFNNWLSLSLPDGWWGGF